MDIKEYAKKILEDAGCDQYTYGGEFSKYVLDDLKKAFPDGMEFPYVDVANAILEMSRPGPIYRAPYRVIWDTGDCYDGFNEETFEAAKDNALTILGEWMTQQAAESSSSDFHEWSDEDIEKWDFMICNCSVEVMRYNALTDEYEEWWSPSYEDEKEIGWLEYEEFMKLGGQK